jgi:hypothetical protein
MVPSLVLSWLYAYNGEFVSFTLDASLVIAVTFFGSAVAATILPWWKPEIYQNSPVARYAIGGLPLISIAGAVTTLFLGWTLWQWITNALYGIGVGNNSSIIFLGVLYGAAVVLRRREALPPGTGRGLSRRSTRRSRRNSRAGVGRRRFSAPDRSPVAPRSRAPSVDRPSVRPAPDPSLAMSRPGSGGRGLADGSGGTRTRGLLWPIGTPCRLRVGAPATRSTLRNGRRSDSSRRFPADAGAEPGDTGH